MVEARKTGRSGATGPASGFSADARVAGGRLIAVVLVLSAVFVLALANAHAGKIFAFPDDIAAAGKEDLVAFWRASRMALAGAAADAYDPARFQEALPDSARELLFLNPPHFFLLIWPLAAFSYGSVKAFWMLASAGALAGIALALWRSWPPRAYLALALIFSPAAYASTLVLQTGPFIALGLLAALLCARDRPILAGLLLALLTVKPQYLLLAPVFLAARGEWRAMIWAGVFTAALVALSAAAFGLESWGAFFASLGDVHAEHTRALKRDMLTIHQTVGKLGGGDGLRAFVQILLTGLSALAVFAASRRWRRDAAAGLALLASAFVAPSLWVYDWPLVAAGLLVMARCCGPWPIAVQILAGLLWIAPLYSLGIATMQSAIAAPTLLAATLAAFYFWTSARERAGRLTDPAA